MKKKVLSLIFMSTLALSLVACGNKKEPDITTKPETKEVQEEVVETKEEVKEETKKEVKEEPAPDMESTIYKAGEHYSIDLNNDGTPEDIFYELEQDPSYPEFHIANLTINDVDCSDILLNLWEPEENYRIVDIDPSDNYYELVFSTYGMSDDLESTFLRYDGESLVLLGTTPMIIGVGTPLDEYADALKINHDGTMTIYTRTDVIETTFIPRTYVIEDNEIKLVEDGTIYDFYTPREDKIETTAELKVYTKPDTSSESVVLPEGTKFDTNKTDATTWTNMIVEDGTEYWIRIDKTGKLLDFDADYDVSTWDVMTGQFLAD